MSELKNPLEKEKKVYPKDSLEYRFDKEYEKYEKNLKEIFPGKGIYKNNYSKILALVNNEHPFLNPPNIQHSSISSQIEKHFGEADFSPEYLKLYPDLLNNDMLLNLSYKNDPNSVRESLALFFMKKYLRLINIREKIISRSSQMLSIRGFNAKTQAINDHKVGVVNTEIEHTIKRIIRLMNEEELRDKDFSYYLKHFKVRRIDSIFIKKNQNPSSSSLRKDDFEVYFRETIYKNKITSTINGFKPNISFIPLKSGLEVWKNSKLYLHNFFKKNFDNLMKKVDSIYRNEKQRCDANDIKLFKEYFKDKYSFYYELKEQFEQPENFSYDIYYPPLIISLNSEIRPYLKELCEYFNIPFDLSIDKGKAFSYNINVFYPNYFAQQDKGFKYNPYELTYSEINSGEFKVENENDEIGNEPKTTEILRKKYTKKDGFLVSSNKGDFYTFKHTSFKGDIYVKKSEWINSLCIFPELDITFLSQSRTLSELGYSDSTLKYELAVLDRVDLGTLGRLVEDMATSVRERIKGTVELIGKGRKKNDNKKKIENKESNDNNKDNNDGDKKANNNDNNDNSDNEYNELRDLVSKIREEGKDKKNLNDIKQDSYSEKIDTDLLKYLMTLRFLKLRDYKFYVLNILNYFRYIQKRLILDSYKIESKLIKKKKHLENINKFVNKSFSNTSSEIKEKDIIINEPISSYIRNNPVIPSLEKITENKGDIDNFDRFFLEDIDEIVEYNDKVIRIKDSRGFYILYDSTLSDLKQLEDEFCRIGTFFIVKKEKMVADTETMPGGAIDRTQIALDIFKCEFEFLYAKFELISEIMSIYENIVDIDEQKKLMKTIIDIISKRPIIDLEYNYFTSSYMIETELLRKKAAFLHILIDYQKKLEIKENLQLHETIDKYYWLLGETALEIINHVDLSKTDIHLLKSLIIEKKNNQKKNSNSENNKLEDIEKLINIFSRLRKEKNIEKNKIKININQNEEKDVNSTSSLPSKLLVLLNFLKCLFSSALTGGNAAFLEEDVGNLLSHSSIEEEEEIGKEIGEVLGGKFKKENENEKDKENKDNENKNSNNNSDIKSNEDKSDIKESNSEDSKTDNSNSEDNNNKDNINNDNMDTLNYEIRSILNIPNPYSKKKHLEYVEKNPKVLDMLNNDLNFVRFEEGFPSKYSEYDSEDEGVEFFFSLSSLPGVIYEIEEMEKKLYEMFCFEDQISKNGIRISLFDFLIEEWEEFRVKFTGKKSISEFEQIYYLQNSILDDYHSFMYSLRNLTYTLSGPLSRTSPELLCYLPLPAIDRKDIHEMEFVKLGSPKDPNCLENMMEEELISSLNNIVKKDYNSGWLDFSNHKALDEVKIYCNAYEQYRTKNVIFNLILKNALLSMIYESQKEHFLNKNEDIQNLKDPLDMKPYSSDICKVNYLDRYFRMSKQQLKEIPKFNIQEFDPSLGVSGYLRELLTVQCNCFDRGIDELKTFASYEYMNFFLLLTASQYNNIVFFNFEKYLYEQNLYRDNGIIVTKGLFSRLKHIEKNVGGLKIEYTSVEGNNNVYNNIYNKKTSNNYNNNNIEESLWFSENEKKIKEAIYRLSNKFFYIVNAKKIKNRSNCLARYEKFVNDTLVPLKRSNLAKQIYSRHERVLICNAYIRDIMTDTYLDMIKIEACDMSEYMRKLFTIIPKEYNPFDVNDIYFLDNEKKIDDILFHKNFTYYHDRTIPFAKFYLPSSLEILQLPSQTKEDILFHYSKYDPFSFLEDPNNRMFISQISDKFFKIEDKNLALKCSSLLYLKFAVFFLTILNFKVLEMCLTQKTEEVNTLLISSKKGLDFWGNKNKEQKKISNNTKITEEIVEKIISNKKNYNNLRYTFEGFKIEIEEVMKHLKPYINNYNDENSMIIFMNNYINYKLYHWYYLLNASREQCLKSDDLHSFTFLTKIIKDSFLYGKNDYFIENMCKYDIHICENISDNDIQNIFKKHMGFDNHVYYLDFLYENNESLYMKNKYIYSISDIAKYEGIKYIFPFVSENKLALIRNLDFRLSSMTKNYLIYIEKSSFNSDVNTLYMERIKFLLNYVKVLEYKFKFLIIKNKKLLPISSQMYINLEKLMFDEHKAFNKVFLDSLNSNYIQEKEEKTDTNNTINSNSNINSVFDSKREDNLKIKNSIVMVNFFKDIDEVVKCFKSESKYILYTLSTEFIEKENKALNDLFSSAKTEIDLEKFMGKFSGNFFRDCDKNIIGSINSKFTFFENFINRINNIGIEVETHRDENAILIRRDEYNKALLELMQEYIKYEVNIEKNRLFSRGNEKFGAYFRIKKLEIWLNAYKKKLKEFDSDLEKISNAKIAIMNNKLVFEMDNLYRQLKVLKDNIKIMEDYINDYFEDKFNSLIQSFKTQMSDINSKFKEFKNDIVIKTNIAITEEYNNCIKLLKEKANSMAQEVNKISQVDTTKEKEFFNMFNSFISLKHTHSLEILYEKGQIDSLQGDLGRLHGFYRAKLHAQKENAEKEMENLRDQMSQNRDLWEKLAISERNEGILKEELARTQKSLASAEEFIKRLRIQIRNSHDKNVSLEKKISQLTIKDIIHNAGKGISAKAVELYNDIKKTYVYNMKNNVNLITSIEKVKIKYEKDEDIKTILDNFEILHKKYAEEIDAKRNFIYTLNNIKKDVKKMNAISNKKIEELNSTIESLKNENERLKIDIDKLRIKNYVVNSSLKSSSLQKSNNINNNNNNINTNKNTNNNSKSNNNIPNSISKNNNMSNVSKSSSDFPYIYLNQRYEEKEK